MKNDDQEWLDTLAGKSQDSKLSTQQIEAAAVRRALLARRESIERDSEKFDPVQFKKVKQTLMKHGYLIPNSESKSIIKRKLALIGAFIAGSVSSSILMIGLTSQVMVTRSTHESSFIENAKAVIFKWKNETQSDEKTILLIDNDPIALAHTIEEKAWEAGLKTYAFSKEGSIQLIIDDIDAETNGSAEIKLLLGIHPQFKGDIKITISK